MPPASGRANRARLHVIVLIPIALLVLAPAAFLGDDARSARPSGPAIRLENTALH
jgi:hypothetical protein